MTAETAPPLTPDTRAARPRTLTAGAAMAVLLGLAISLYGVYLVVTAATSSAHSDPGSTAFGGAIVVLMGMLPLFAGRALLQLKRWGRSPAVLMDTLCLAVAYVALRGTGADVPLGILAAAFGVTGIVLLLHPKTTAALWPENVEQPGAEG